MGFKIAGQNWNFEVLQVLYLLQFRQQNCVIGGCHGYIKDSDISKCSLNGRQIMIL